MFNIYHLYLAAIFGAEESDDSYFSEGMLCRLSWGHFECFPHYLNYEKYDITSRTLADLALQTETDEQDL